MLRLVRKVEIVETRRLRLETGGEGPEMCSESFLRDPMGYEMGTGTFGMMWWALRLGLGLHGIGQQISS
jgi:hypothetical protein